MAERLRRLTRNQLGKPAQVRILLPSIFFFLLFFFFFFFCIFFFKNKQQPGLSFSTTEETLQIVFEEYGRVKRVRLVRDIVTGASRGYAFVEMDSSKDLAAAYRFIFFLFRQRKT